MGEIYTMTDYKPATVNPKVVKGRHEGQLYILRFNPDAKSESERWCWEVQITKTYSFYGTAKNENLALRDSKKMIDYRTGNHKVV